MTPVEIIQAKIAEAKESELLGRLLRNVGWGVVGLTAIALFVVALVFMVNFLYAFIGVWAALLGAIVLLGTLIGVAITMLE